MIFCLNSVKMQKDLKNSAILISGILIAVFAVAISAARCDAENKHKDGKLKVTLELVQAYDMRFPTLSETDVKQVVDEAKRMIRTKLGGGVELDFHDNGAMTLDELFGGVNYRQQQGALYKNVLPWKYDIDLGENAPILLNSKKDYEEEVLTFLHRWDLTSLAHFFPDRKIESYGDAFYALMATYHEKVRWLKTLKTKSGEYVLIRPYAPYQSQVEWMGYAEAQDKYDVIITNTLIVLDNMIRPYPHGICKHGKIGGQSMYSPRRQALNGRSLLVNIFEDYGDVTGISPPVDDRPRELKNKSVGGYFLAHEFGHVFFLLPDFYDHGGGCLMNSSLEASSSAEGYRLLSQSDSPCPLCRPWVVAKSYVLRAMAADAKGRFNESAKLYLIAKEVTPTKLDTNNYDGYTKWLLAKACEEFGRAMNTDAIEKHCMEIINK